MKSFWLDEGECTGCAACMNVCPVDAIEMISDDEGFVQPVIDDACIDCNACEMTCLRRRGQCEDSALEPDVLAAVSRSDAIRFESTSGGVFYSLGNATIADDGVVFGAIYDDENRVKHASAETEASLHGLMQSKYVQSDTGYAFREVKERLLKGQAVAFCGTPCQVAGLRAYLNKDYENLTLIDFVCRGINSPKAYKAWTNELEHKERSKISRIWFKYKDGGWKTSPRRTRIDFTNGKTVILEGDRNLFMEGYLSSNLYMRPCCGKCAFKGFPRMGDITLADFWGLKGPLEDDRGTSMVLVNNEKGGKALDGVRDSLELEQQPFDSIFGGNVCILDSAECNPKSRDFLTSLDDLAFSEAVRKYGTSRFLRKAKRLLRRFTMRG